MKNEIWKDISGYEGLYQASNFGCIKSFPRLGTFGGILKPRLSKTHYCVVLYKNNILKKYYIHRLILETFIGPCPPGMECRHLDNNPQNNRLDNLKWDTHYNNMQDKIKFNTGYRGCDNAKLIIKEIIEIKKLLKEKIPQRTIAKLFNISQSTTSNINRGINWGDIQ